MRVISDVTRLFVAIEEGDDKAADRLLPLVYQELRKLAATKLSKEKPGHSLQPTMLVHEAYLRLVDVEIRSSGMGEATFSELLPKRCGGFLWRGLVGNAEV